MTRTPYAEALERPPERTERATFGAGCFWKPEAELREIAGVLETAVGYEGGHVEAPGYEQVCTGTTGHAEVCQVTFDPDVVSYERLLEAFWRIHDPTQVDRQGPDVGSQYRSVIFTHSDEQAEAARRSRDALAERLPRPVATSIEPSSGFWQAEGYHQCYMERRGPRISLSSLMGR